MYQFLLIIQILCVFCTVLCVSSLIQFRLGNDQRILTIASGLVCVDGVGYLLEMLAQTKEAAMTALTFQYLGLIYMATTFVRFVLEYAEIKTKKYVWIITSVVNTVFLTFLLVFNREGVFYKSIGWTEEGLFPHLLLIPGPLFIIFVILQVIYLSFAIVICSLTLKKTKRKSKRRRLRILISMCFLPILGVALHYFILDSGYNPVSLFAMIATFHLCYVLTHWKMINIAERAYTSLFKEIEQGVIIADAERRYIQSNTTADYIFPEMKSWDPGVSLDELGMDICSFGRKEPFERNGKFFSSIAAPIVEQRKNVGYLVVISDVTQQQQRYDEMRELKEASENANQAKSAFLANMSHEIRTPLNAIIGMAELAEREASVSSIYDYLSQIKSSGKMLLDIICETLDLSKAESGKLEIVPVEFDSLDLLNGVINVINMRMADRSVKFIVDVDPMLPRTLFGDDIRIRQVLINFLGNAVKYTKSGSITFKVGFDILDVKKISMSCSVEDTGSGISEDDLEKLFKPFSQVDMKKNRKIVGTGLGLAISAELIRLMDGTKNVKSKYGEGSTFSFEIPLFVVDCNPCDGSNKGGPVEVNKLATFKLFENEDARDEIPRVQEEMPQFSNARVLVVDDNKVNVKVLSAFLKQFGIECDKCYSGEDALLSTEDIEYDLIFMDHMMPDMDGAETSSKIRKSEKEWNKKVKIVACSANVMKGADELFLESGMDDYISKPIQIDVLKKKLIKYLSN